MHGFRQIPAALSIAALLWMDYPDARGAEPSREDERAGTKRIAILGILTPKRDVSTVSVVAQVARVAKRSLEVRLGLRAQTLDDLRMTSRLMEECSSTERLRCWLRAFEEHRPDVIVVVTLYPRSEGIEWLSSLVLDVNRARAIEAGRTTSPGDQGGAIEDAIFARATRLRSISLMSTEDTELERFFGELFLPR